MLDASLHPSGIQGSAQIKYPKQILTNSFDSQANLDHSAGPTLAAKESQLQLNSNSRDSKQSCSEDVKMKDLEGENSAEAGVTINKKEIDDCEDDDHKTICITNMATSKPLLKPKVFPVPEWLQRWVCGL